MNEETKKTTPEKKTSPIEEAEIAPLAEEELDKVAGGADGGEGAAVCVLTQQ